jgi:hypothetical protein
METAINKLKRLTAYEAEPLLTDADLDAALTSAAIRDTAGNVPRSVSWVPTYDLAAAAVEAWLVKAARASTLVETDPTTGEVSSKVFENCLAMARLYRMKRNCTVQIR